MRDLIQSLFTGDVVYVLLLVFVGGGVLAGVLAVRYLLASRVDVVSARLKRSVMIAPSSMPPPMAQPGTGGGGFLEFAMRPFARLARPSDEEAMGRLRATLSHAGYRSEQAIVIYLALKVLLGLGLAGTFLWVNSVRVTPMPVQTSAFVTVLLMVLGVYAPNMWLSGRVTDRQKKVSSGLPDTLDLLVTCVEAGLGLDLALGRVSTEIGLSAPLLCEELTQTSLEMRAGVPRGEAFRRLAARTGVEDIKNLSSIVIQTEIFGTSIAKSLRVMSETMRIKRMQRAEEKAAMVAVKMTMPLILNIMPALFAVLMGPAVVRIYRMFAHGINSGVGH